MHSESSEHTHTRFCVSSSSSMEENERAISPTLSLAAEIKMLIASDEEKTSMLGWQHQSNVRIFSLIPSENMDIYELLVIVLLTQVTTRVCHH